MTPEDIVSLGAVLLLINGMAKLAFSPARALVIRGITGMTLVLALFEFAAGGL